MTVEIKLQPCRGCGGKGWIDTQKGAQICPICGGSGTESQPRPAITWFSQPFPFTWYRPAITWCQRLEKFKDYLPLIFIDG